jgi:hypothetical protein
MEIQSFKDALIRKRLKMNDISSNGCKWQKKELK